LHKQLNIWAFAVEKLRGGNAVILLYVVDSKGSSPGRKGFFMIVSEDGMMKGSIGGGIMEHKFVELAREKLSTHADEDELRKQIHDKAAARNQSGMICSGEQTIFMYSLSATDISSIALIIDTLVNFGNGLFRCSPEGISFQPGIVPPTDFLYRFVSKDDWIYEEKIGYKNHLHIIGGGHCALSLSKVMAMMDFYIHLYDDRENLNTFKENDFVHEKILLDDYSQLKNQVTGDEHTWVVVMTFGYRTDDLAVRSLLGKPFAYFGLLGSATKIQKLFSGYLEEGIPPALIENIHAPVGLPINSQTPEEIAISIAAEIIQEKNKKEKKASGTMPHLYQGKF
jgi:xanthine dehydrogenase accessory factor